MDQSFISVGRICDASAYSEEIGSFRSGASLKYGQGKLWDDVFAQTDQLFSIGTVTPAELELAHPDLSPAQQKSLKKYLDAERYPHFKAFAAEVDGDYSGWGWGYNKPKEAIETAMQSCAKKGANCRIYAVGERVVTNFNQDQLSNFLREYYEEVLQFGDLRDIRQHALSGDEINALISGREGEGVTFLHGLKFTMRFMASGRLMVRIIESKTALSPGNYGGEWWIEGDRYCRKYDKVLSGRTECFYVIKEDNGIAWYTEDGALNDRIRFTTPLRNVGKDIKQNVQATDQPKETPKVASIPKDVSDAGISLRKEPMEITNEMKIAKMLVKYDFFDIHRNPFGSFVNDLVDNNDGTVTDKATGLMWQKSGSLSSTDNLSAKEYLMELNRQRFAGYSDWRMPTIEELASLFTRKRTNGVYLDPVFSNQQVTCWAIDKYDAGSLALQGVWIGNFKQGQISRARFHKRHSGQASWGSHAPINAINYVKAVRSAK